MSDTNSSVNVNTQTVEEALDTIQGQQRADVPDTHPAEEGLVDKAAVDAAEAADAVRAEANGILRDALKAFKKGERGYRDGLLESGRLVIAYVVRRMQVGDKREAAVQTVVGQFGMWSSDLVDQSYVNRLCRASASWKLLALDRGVERRAAHVPYGHLRDAWSQTVEQTGDGYRLMPEIEAEVIQAFDHACANGLSKQAVHETVQTLVYKANGIRKEAEAKRQAEAKEAEAEAARLRKEKEAEAAAARKVEEDARREREEAERKAKQEEDETARAQAEATAAEARKKEEDARREREAKQREAEIAAQQEARSKQEARDAGKNITQAEAARKVLERKLNKGDDKGDKGDKGSKPTGGTGHREKSNAEDPLAVVRDMDPRDLAEDLLKRVVANKEPSRVLTRFFDLLLDIKPVTKDGKVVLTERMTDAIEAAFDVLEADEEPVAA